MARLQTSDNPLRGKRALETGLARIELTFNRICAMRLDVFQQIFKQD